MTYLKVAETSPPMMATILKKGQNRMTFSENQENIEDSEILTRLYERCWTSNIFMF